MIKEIIDILNTDNFYKVSNRVDRAKGLYSKPQNIREAWEQFKRVLYGKR